MKVKAPWNREQVAALNRWQMRDDVHEFTCGGPNPEDHPHGKVLIATTEGWMCLDCTYTQDWAHDFMMEDK